MDETLRILIVEDLPTDAELAQREIRKTFKSCEFRVVDTREDFLEALEQFQPDLIVSDYRMPRFDGLTALKLALELAPLTPMIILTSAINEDTAVECMKAGAADYVIKEHIKRLGQAIIRALEERQLREQRRQVDEDLRASEERYRHLVESSNDWVWEVDQDAVYTYAGPQCRELLGYEPEEIVGKTPFDLMLPEEAQRVSSVFGPISARRESFRGLENLNLRKDGRMVVLETNGAPVFDEQGGFRGYRGMDRDITERKKAEEALRKSEEKYRGIFENVQDVYYETFFDGTIIEVSPSIEAVSKGQYRPKDLIGKSILDFYSDSVERQSLLSALEERGSVTDYEVTLKNRDGSLVPCSISSKIWPDAQGKPIKMIGSLRDITARKQADEEKKKLEAQLIQAQKLEALGTLAGGIAHDFNNILGAIIGYAELSQLSLSETDELHAYQSQILTAGQRAKELVQQILTVARPHEHVKVPVEVHLIAKEVVRLMSQVVPSTVVIKYSIDSQAGTVLADPAQLHQVLMNLCANAAHAMRQQSNGVLDIQLEPHILDEESPLFLGNLPPGEYVRLQVIDNGHGMDSKTMDRIFDPYFTTKKKGEGTGLGLAVVRGIVTNHGGAIHVKSEIGKGSVFQIYLPRISSPKSSKKEKVEKHLRGDERILLVDDESQLVNIGRSMLQRLGYKVTATNSSAEALEIFLARPHDFDLVLTDQTMPDITGIHLAEEILSVRSDIPIVLNTGFSDQIDPEQAKQIGISEFLEKPFTAAILSAALRRALEKKKEEGKK